MEDVKIVNQYEYMGRAAVLSIFLLQGRDVTFGTLGRIHGRYVMSIAEGQAFQEPMEKLAEEVRTWAQGFVRLNCDPMKFYENLRSNHCAACYGKCMPELIEFCRIAGVGIH